MRRFCALFVFLFALLIPVAGGAATRSSHATYACSTSMNPPAAYHGACGTFNGRSTWYGSDWVGSPLPVGWGLCAWPAAHGGSYPHGAYRYSAAVPPRDISLSSMNALGWAFSEATRRGWMAAGVAGQFSANDMGVAAKLLYDALAYSLALPRVAPGEQRALTALADLVALGRSVADTPSITLSLVGGGTAVSDHGSVDISVRSPSGVVIPGQNLTVRLNGATSGGAHLINILTTTTPTRIDFVASSTNPSSVTVAATATVAVPGMLFFDPTYLILDAQTVATPRAPRAIGASLSLTASGTPRGQVAIVKTVDDAAYFSPGNATFTLLDPNGLVVASLTTGADGTTGPSALIPAGSYTLHEEVAPEGYGVAVDQAVTVVANEITTVTVGPTEGDRAITGSFDLVKMDRASSEPLAGARFTLTADPTNTRSANGSVAACLTDSAGRCHWDNLLPGYYFVAETQPPDNYLASFAGEWVWVGPGDAAGLDVVDDPVMLSIGALKYNSAQRGTVIPGAVYDLYVASNAPWAQAITAPLDAETFADLHFVERATTSSTGQLAFSVRSGYRWCLREVSVPGAYVVDPDLHCTSGPVTTSSSTADTTVALPETASSVILRLHKFNAATPSAGVPGAYYALYVQLPYPIGFTAPAATDVHVPAGYGLWDVAETGAGGFVDLSVPSGHRWCVAELFAPQGYQLDPATHCTSGPVTSTGTLRVVTVAAPEVALPVTGFPTGTWCAWGLSIFGFGVAILRRQVLRNWWAAITK